MEKSMPEVQTSKSEKMVPIDTSGDAVDVELNDTNDEVQVEQVKEETPQVEVQETSTETKPEELEEYSVGVKKRIDKLTKKMREAERREQAAIEYAKKAQEKLKHAESVGMTKDQRNIEEGTARIKTQEEFTKRAMEAAIQANDVEKQVAAQQQMAKLELEKEKIKVSQRRLEAAKIAPKEEEVPSFDNQVQEQQVQQAPKPTPEAEDWAEANPWFNKDRVMTASAMVIHQDLAEEGFDLNGQDYYNEISRRIRKEFPHKFEDKSKPTQKVASAVRTSPSGRRTVRLTPSQVAIAKKLGVPLEEYAKHVKEA
jgi:hypothetical protein